ncbi:MAG: hypothetical protein RTV72_08425 [Candidatus Thorarchaeota archaeon]
MLDLKDIIFEPIEYENLTENQWIEFTKFHNEAMEMFQHGIPEKSVEAVKKQYLGTNPQTEPLRIFAMNKEKSVFYSGSGLYRATEKDPNYEINKHIGYVMGTVRLPYQRKKIASKLLQLLAIEAKKVGLNSIESGVFLESAKRFWEYLGAKVVDRDFTSDLRADEIDYDLIEQWREEGKKRAVGVSLEFYSRIPDDILEEFLALHEEVHGIEADLEGHEREGRHAMSVETYHHRTKQNEKAGVEVISLLSRETEGAISGFTEVYFMRKDEPGRVNQGMTGVGRKYQGRGIGKWLKAEMIVHLKEIYPKMTEIRTGNATVNAPMLSINRRLGFKTIRDGVTFNIDVDELLEKLKNV